MILNQDIEILLNQAMQNAHKNRYEFMDIEQMILAILNEKNTAELVKECGADFIRYQRNLDGFILQNSPKIADEVKDNQWSPQLSIGAQRVLQRAWLQVVSSGRNEVRGADILVSLYSETDCHALHFLENEEGISRIQLLSTISHGDYSNSQTASQPQQGQDDYDESSPALSEYCIHLNSFVNKQEIPDLVGRDKELERLMQILMRKQKNNPLLVGEPGVGKTAIVFGLAKKVEQDQVPEPLKDLQIYSLDMGLLLAGAKFKGEFEDRVKAVLKDLKSKKERAVLFIDEIHSLIGAGSGGNGGMDASNLLKPALASGELSCIGAATFKELRKYFEKDRALERRFQKIEVNEPNDEETLEILKGIKSTYEKFHNIKLSAAVLESTVQLSNRYLSGRFQPDKSIDVIDELGAQHHLRNTNKKAYTVTDKDVEDVVSKMAQVPSQNVSQDDRSRLQNLERDLKMLIFGQDEAVEKVSHAIKFSRAGLNRDNKPIGSYLFAGPTGVGKTELAKQLANILGIEFVRFDMSEYMEKHSVSRLVGAPPGYVGYDEGGLLTDAISKKPYSLILMDEIEKAHPDLINILLQLMDDGSLTDANGKKADARNIILIMTTNAGARDMAKKGIGIMNSIESNFDMEQIKKAFAPEFINRLDAVIAFKNLDKAMLLKVIEKFLLELQNQLQDKNVKLEYDEELLEKIFDVAYDPIYGARPMQRKINDLVKAPLVDELLFGKLKNGGTVKVKMKADKIDFQYS